jgi:hypothetical protein
MDWIQDDIDRASGKKRKWDGANIRFFTDESRDDRKSDEAGHFVPRNVLCVEVKFPGFDTTVVRATPEILREYKREYDAFMANEEPVTEGTPLSQWPVINKAVADEFKRHGFKTVEQLAAAPDEVKKKFGSISSFCKEAKTWVESSDSTQATVAKLKKQLEKSEAARVKLEEQFELALQRIGAIEGTRHPNVTV